MKDEEAPAIAEDERATSRLEILRAELANSRGREERLRADNQHLLKNQRVLQDDRDRYAEIYEVAPFAYVTHDRRGVILTTNIMASILLQIPSQGLAGNPLKEWVTTEDRRIFLGHLLGCQREPYEGSCDLRLARRDGTLISVRLSSRRAGPGQSLFATAILDLCEHEREVEQRRALLEAERNARAASDAKDQFIATLSHELRTPLTPVLLAVCSLAERRDFDESLRAKFAMMKRNVIAEARLIDDLLDVTRIARGKMRIEKEITDVHSAIQDSVEILEHEIRAKSLTVTLGLEAAERSVRGDPARLRQVFWNLLRNAVKFTPSGGRVEIRSWNREDWVMVEVSDSGTGISADALPRLFLPFEQPFEDPAASRGGLGLGLTICRGILQLHDGHIFASSAGVGQGARFVVEIPTTAVRAAVPQVAAAVATSAQAPRILLVEDDEDTAEILAEFLRDEGYQIQIARSVESALKVDVGSIDVVLSDVGLGDGSGLDLMRQLRTRGDIKGIALSGFGTEADFRASREAGFELHLTKPVMLPGLIAAINVVAGGAIAGGSAGVGG